MEYAPGGDLLKLTQSHMKKRTKIKEKEIWKALVHITNGLKSLHDKKILHRDLKGANIFITADGKYKIGDLNVSKVIKYDCAKTQTGTPYYASPEVWKDHPYGTKSDMWSLGCVLYEMAAQRPPFTAPDIQSLYKKICNGSFARIPPEYSNELASVISLLLKVTPGDRPSAGALLNNPVVQDNYGDSPLNRLSWETDELLQTIKLNSRNYKEINDLLPKPKYERE
jgi:NIMA (never in mitosis gene a)-related kinase 1/4/5